MRPARLIVLCLGLLVAGLSLWALERARAGLAAGEITAGTTPVTLYASGDGPLVIVAHGFAGSRQLMQAISFTLARAGYRVAAFDFEGHGRNPTPMSGDVTRIDGTTQRLVEETRAVERAARAATEYEGPVAFVGHSMATDIVIRAADPARAAAVAAISMYSDAVTADHPPRLLVVTGQFEPHLRENALRALRLVDGAAGEGGTAAAGEVRRRALVAPGVEHVGVLYAPVTLRAVRDWLDEAFGRESGGPVAAVGLPLAALMVALVAMAWPLAGLLPPTPRPARLPRRTFLLALLLSGPLAALATAAIRPGWLPVLIGDALAVHLFTLGAIQLIVLRMAGHWLRPAGWGAVALLLFWGLLVFGAALDRYGASFWPIPERWPVMAVLVAGTVPCMLADAHLTEAGHAPFWRRAAVRLTLFLSLGAAIALDPGRLLFVVTVLPLLILFYLVHGLMGRWAGLRAGPFGAGLGLGLILAWALGTTVPLFAA